MNANNVSTFGELEGIFESKVLAIAASKNKQVMVWQDVVNNGVKLDPNTVVEIWRVMGT